jgi:RNA polymerase sigma factor (sigma-70 family)
MRDSEIVAAIVAGEPDGLAEAYDRYAAPLYTYCRSLLREPADAADAVQDTFVIAASKLAGLRDASRLRPWLYAVARNECHRRLRDSSSAATSALDQVPEMSDETADVTGGAERAELRTLLRSAVRGLNASEQDLIELQLRQELDVAEIAAVLGVTRNHAHALLSRARSQLEVSLGALLVARSGRGDCEALSALLADWDGQLNVLMRKRINRHIERCPECTERKRRELAPALLLGAAAVPAVAMPPGLRTRVLRLASSNTPDAVAHRAELTQRAEMAGAGGFPVPFDQGKPAWYRARRNQGAAAAAVIAAAAVLIILAVTGVLGGHHSQLSALSRGSSGPGSGGSSGTGAAGAGTGSAGAGTGSGGTGTGGAGTGGNGSGGTGPTASAAARVSPSPSAGRAAPGGGPSPAASSPGPGPGSSQSGSSGAPTPSHHPSPSSPAPSSSSAPPPPRAGTLSVAPLTIVLSPLGGGSLTLTASGGPVNWSITESPGLIGELTVTPVSGRLQAGQSATVGLRVSAAAGTVTAARAVAAASAMAAARAAPAGVTLTSATGTCANCTLTVNPGDITITVLIEANASPTPTKSSCPPSSSPPSSSPSSDSYSPGAPADGGVPRERLVALGVTRK